MKVSIDIDCTPEEARRFLGLPDVTPVNEVMISEMKKRVTEMGADKMIQQWMTTGAQGIGDLQRAFFEQFAKPAGGKD